MRCPVRHRMPAALFVGLAAAHAGAQAQGPVRAVMEPVPGIQVSYEHAESDGDTSPPGRFDGSIDTPAGTLRTTVHAVPAGEQPFQRGDTTFELRTPILGGQLQVHELQAGGTAAVWRAQFDGLAAQAQCEWTPVRSAQSLQLQQQLLEGRVAQALLARSSTASGEGTRWDLAFTEDSSLARWSAGIAAAERGYVSASGGPEPRIEVRLDTQWKLFPYAWMDARYTRQVLWDSEEAVSSVMLGTRFELPWRLTLVTALETDTEHQHKASLTLTVPLQAP